MAPHSAARSRRRGPMAGRIVSPGIAQAYDISRRSGRAERPGCRDRGCARAHPRDVRAYTIDGAARRGVAADPRCHHAAGGGRPDSDGWRVRVPGSWRRHRTLGAQEIVGRPIILAAWSTGPLHPPWNWRTGAVMDADKAVREAGRRRWPQRYDAARKRAGAFPTVPGAAGDRV